ncbi:MAG: type I restriction enzyme HsdR N-terminal domain-containing protein [Bacteroidetes bacterium]|nr:type I restriction enzyme HsdR N-terminal domain-containing protein [Bacteroidota bacterium]
MEELNLPQYNFRIRKENGRNEIFDLIRKKFVSLTPEEWVRQNFLMFLIKKKGYPESLITVEKSLMLNSLLKRTDLVIYSNTGLPKLIVECKATSIKITQKSFDQIARYNMTLKVDYLIVTNGLTHFICQIDYKKKTYYFLKEVPFYDEIKNS